MLRFMVFCLLAVLFGTTEGYFVCEGQRMYLKCGAGRAINIVRASYGRTQQGRCGNGGNTNCHAGSSMRVVRRECHGLQSCILQAKNSAFGDPCPGTFKYLEVTYNCLKTSSPEYLLRICESQSRAISCYSGSIKIISANYGRLTGGHICPGPIKTTNCGAAGSLGKVKNACHKQQHCALHATNSDFGDPCYGTKKYLEVRYKCE